MLGSSAPAVWTDSPNNFSNDNDNDNNNHLVADVGHGHELGAGVTPGNFISILIKDLILFICFYINLHT